MGFIKTIARSILRNEINDLKEKAENFESRTYELREEMVNSENKYKAQLSDVAKERTEKDTEKILAEQKMRELEKENEILRQYYDLDKEPSDEIKMKMHIDLEINRLKEENLKLVAMRSQLAYIPQPYPVYRFGRGLF